MLKGIPNLEPLGVCFSTIYKGVPEKRFILLQHANVFNFVNAALLGQPILWYL